MNCLRVLIVSFAGRVYAPSGGPVRGHFRCRRAWEIGARARENWALFPLQVTGEREKEEEAKFG